MTLAPNRRLPARLMAVAERIAARLETQLASNGEEGRADVLLQGNEPQIFLRRVRSASAFKHARSNHDLFTDGFDTNTVLEGSEQ